MAFNKVILMGNLTADPELKTTTGGISVTSFTIAVGRRFIPKDGEAQTDFINVVAWRQLAEFICKYFNKGKQILVCGSLQTRNFTDKEGNKRYVTEVVADEATFVGKKEGGPEGNSNARTYDHPAAVSPYASHPQDSQPKFEELADDDDLPF